MTKEWKSTGIAAHDFAVGAHQGRLECIQKAIYQLGRLRNEWGFAIDQLPGDVNDARDALWKAYHAERKRGDALYEWERAHPRPSSERSEEEER